MHDLRLSSWQAISQLVGKSLIIAYADFGLLRQIVFRICDKMQYQLLKHQYDIKYLVECFKTLISQYIKVLFVENLSFHGFRPLGHNETNKSVKVPIFPQVLKAAVVCYMTA